MTAPASVSLFDGFDSFNAVRRDAAVSGTAGSPIDASTGLTVLVCRDYKELQSALDIDPSVAGSYSAASVDTKVSFMQRLQLNCTSLVVVIRATRATMQVASATPGFTADAEQMLSSDSIQKAFVARYGDAYVSRVTLGAEYIATIVFDCTTHSEQAAVAAMTRGGPGSRPFEGIMIAAAASASPTGDAHAFHVPCRFDQLVTGYDGDALPGIAGARSPEELQTAINMMIQFAAAFGSRPAPAAPAVIGFATAPYETLAPDRNFGHLATNRRIRMGSPPSDPGLYATIARLCNVSASCAFVNRIYEYYGCVPKDPAHDDWVRSDWLHPELQQQIHADLDTLTAIYQSMAGDPTAEAPALPVNLRGLQYGAPELNIERFENSQVCGGTHGTPFKDIGPADVSRLGRLTTLGIQFGEYIRRLDLTYSYGSGLSPRVVHYGVSDESGPLKCMADLAPDEFIVSFKAWLWDAGPGDVHSITFRTSTGRTVTTRFGRGVSADPDPIATHAVNYIDWKRQMGEVFVGLDGEWVGEGIKNLSVVSMQIWPINWVH